MRDSEPIVVQVYCRVEVVVEKPAALLDHAERELRDADIDWANEPDTLREAVDELRGDLAGAVASLVDPERMLAGVPGVEMRGGRYWAEVGPASERFQPGFGVTG